MTVQLPFDIVHPFERPRMMPTTGEALLQRRYDDLLASHTAQAAEIERLRAELEKRPNWIPQCKAAEIWGVSASQVSKWGKAGRVITVEVNGVPKIWWEGAGQAKPADMRGKNRGKKRG